MVINDDKGGLIFFRIRGKEERERERNRKGKNRGGIRPEFGLPPVGILRHHPPMGTTCRYPATPLSFLLSSSRGSSNFARSSSLSFFRTHPSRSCAPRHPCPTFSREYLTVVEGQFVLLWEPRRDRTIKPRIRNWIVITLDGLEEEILFFFFKKSGSISRFKGRDFFSPTICLNYEKMERKYLKEI